MSRLEVSRQTHTKEEPMNNKAAKNAKPRRLEVENTKTIECKNIYEICLEDS